MASERAIDLALDLARMPAFAPAMAATPLPVDILEVIRIAAESPDACRAAALTTGQPEPVLIEAARFYLQQILFSPDADCYRILGIRAGDSRESARTSMRWLLLWLHPDRNGRLDAIYSERVLKAWREVSNGGDASSPKIEAVQSKGRRWNKTGRFRASIRLPLIKQPIENVSMGNPKQSPSPFRAAASITAGLAGILLLLGLTAFALGSNPMRELLGPVMTALRLQ